MSGYRDQKKCDNCGQWLDPLEKCGCLSTTPPSVPAGEREAFEAAYVKVCGYPAATIANFWEPTQQYYMDDGLQSHWLLWDARASSPAPALERRVPGGPACPTCGFKITVGKKPPFMSDDDPAPALELTAEDREQIRQARVRDPQVHREALSIHERDRRNLLAIITRLTGSADGEPRCPHCLGLQRPGCCKGGF